MFENSLWIALGGALGTLGRFWLSEAFVRWIGAGFPWGTVIVNITGCFAIGLIAGMGGPEGRLADAPLARQFLMIGLCGGYTTFSAFSLQTLAMIQRGAVGVAAAHVAASVILCLLAVWLGTVASPLAGGVKSLG